MCERIYRVFQSCIIQMATETTKELEQQQQQNTGQFSKLKWRKKKQKKTRKKSKKIELLYLTMNVCTNILLLC